MTLPEAKQKFIQTWGTLGSKWGINRTMAQVHALLLISAHSLSADDIMETLSISRGNANMNLRALIDWGLIQKEHKAGIEKSTFRRKKIYGKQHGKLLWKEKNENCSQYLMY